MKTLTEFSTARRQGAGRSGFTLIELLTVIAIIGALAGLTLVVTKDINITKARSAATAELNQIENALENYKAKYGVYPPSNANTYPAPLTNSLLPQLYYELSGVSNNGTGYVTFGTLDNAEIGSSGTSQVKLAFGVNGFLNCTKGNGEEIIPAQNFLLGWRAKQIASVNDGGVLVSILTTSVGGPDASYMPLGPGTAGINPFRYVYPGINHPESYDLYVQLVISGKTNLICNWTKQVIINSPLP